MEEAAAGTASSLLEIAGLWKIAGGPPVDGCDLQQDQQEQHSKGLRVTKGGCPLRLWLHFGSSLELGGYLIGLGQQGLLNCRLNRTTNGLFF